MPQTIIIASEEGSLGPAAAVSLPPICPCCGAESDPANTLRVGWSDARGARFLNVPHCKACFEHARKGISAQYASERCVARGLSLALRIAGRNELGLQVINDAWGDAFRSRNADIVKRVVPSVESRRFRGHGVRAWRNTNTRGTPVVVRVLTILAALGLVGWAVSVANNNPNPSVPAVAHDENRAAWLVTGNYGGLFGDPLVAVTVDGERVAGAVLSDSLEGCGRLDGRRDAATITLADGKQATAVFSRSADFVHDGTRDLGTTIVTITEKGREPLVLPMNRIEAVLDPAPLVAASLGVTDAGSAAVVLAGGQTFAMKSARLWGVRRSPFGCFDRQLGGVGAGRTSVRAVPPGLYRMAVEYSGEDSIVRCVGDLELKWGFGLTEGRADRFFLEEGSRCSAIYTKPTFRTTAQPKGGPG